MHTLDQIKLTENEVNSIIEFIPVQALWVNEQLQIQNVNEVFLSFVAKKRNEVIDTSLHDFPFQNLIQYCMHIDLLRNRDLSIVDYFQMRNSKKAVRFFIKELNKGSSFLILGFDLSNEIIRQEIIDEARRHYEESARFMLIGQMAAGISHEVNNPLAIISGYLSKMKTSIERGDVNSMKENLITMIDKSKKSLERITMIVRGFEFLAKHEYEVVPENIHVRKVIANTLDLCLEKFKVSGINLIIEDADPEMVIECRPIQMTQVILNVLMNAYDATVNIETEKWIKISFQRDHNNIIISVTDSGVGMTKEVRSKIMQPFFTTKSGTKAIGLGLSTSKIILKAHGGDLIYDETCPHTKFNLILPQKLHKLTTS